MNLIVSNDIDDLSGKLAAWIMDYINETLKKQPRFTIVLSGGSTPKKLYGLLASSPLKDKIDWKKIHFFWGDERYVPFSDERNNAKMAFDSLLNHVPVKKENIHIIRTDIDARESASNYEEILHRYFPDNNHSFDLVLLGMGDNAHTLSLFPGYNVVHEKEKWVRSFYLKEQEMYRITLTSPVVNAANRIVFLVSGGDKAAALYHVLSTERNPDLYPSQVIQPYNGELYWWVDELAVKDIQ